MKNSKAIIGILLVFLLGAACGAIVTHMVQRAGQEAFNNGGPAAREELLVKKLTRKLDLSQKQQAEVRAIVHENHAAIQELRNQARPQMEALLEQGQKRINAILRPEQQAKFQQIIAERKNKRPRNQ